MNALPPIPEQPPLFLLPPRFAVSKREQHVYDASRLREKRPDVYRAIVVMTQRGDGQLLIAETLSLSHHLVARVQDLEPDAVAIGKAARSRQNKRIDAVAGDLLLKQLHDPQAAKKIAPRDVAVIKGIAHKAALELDGDDPLTHAARVAAAPQHEALNAFVRLARERTHLAAEKMAPTREGASPGSAGQPEVVEVAVLPESLPTALPRVATAVIADTCVANSVDTK